MNQNPLKGPQFSFLSDREKIGLSLAVALFAIGVAVALFQFFYIGRV